MIVINVNIIITLIMTTLMIDDNNNEDYTVKTQFIT